MKTSSYQRNLLVVDDDPTFCETVKDGLESDNLKVTASHTVAEGLTVCSQRRVDVVLLDENLPDGRGHEVCPLILERNEQAKIIFVTAYPSFNHAVEALRAGAHDYLSKPFDLGDLRLAVTNTLRTLELERVEQLQGYRTRKDQEQTILVGHAGGMAEIGRLVNLSASTDAPVLITGETGVGKNVVARSIHYHGANRDAPFVAINCAAVPENLIDDELFGHEKGAFTGASTAHRGVFEMAEGGTLFLDEIGELPFSLQGKLLGVLEDKTVRRIGGESIRPVHVRIITATNTVVDHQSEKRSLREDLYHRLSVLRIHIPPLRKRKDDIPELCDFFIANLSQGRDVWLPASELDLLKSYHWPGNVRELRNVLERSILLQGNGPLRPSRFLQRNSGDPPTGFTSPNGIRNLEEVEKQHILLALGQLDGNYTGTARALGISLSTLKRKLKAYKRSASI